jgi:hypothetical protein
VGPGGFRRPRSRAELLRLPLLLGAGGAAATVALHLRDPHQAGSWGQCPFLFVTGLPCPGCGGLRAVNDLTRGDVLGALSSNAAAVALVAVMGLAWVVWVVRRWRGKDVPWVRLSKPWAFAVVAVLAVFAVLRWTPWGVALRP